MIGIEIWVGIVLAILVAATLIIFVVKVVKKQLAKQEKLAQDREEYNRRVEDNGKECKIKDQLLHLTPGARVELDGLTYEISAMTTFTHPRFLLRRRFVLDDGDSAALWLDIQVYSGGTGGVYILQECDYAGTVPNESRDDLFYGERRFELCASGGLYHSPEVRSTTEREVLRYVDFKAVGDDSSERLHFEKLEDGPWMVWMRKEIKPSAVTVLSV